jgi:peptidoglycan hydrolase CwlO-like protein
MQDKWKKLFLTAGAVLLIIVAIIRNMPSEGERSVKNAPRQKKAAALKTGSAAPLMKAPVKPSLHKMTADDSAGADEYQKQDQKVKVDGLEQEIRELHQAKENEQRQLDTLLAAVDEAQGKPKLTAGAEPKKESEINFLRMFLKETINKRLKSLDASLKEKLQEYNSAVKDQGSRLEYDE